MAFEVGKRAPRQSFAVRLLRPCRSLEAAGPSHGRDHDSRSPGRDSVANPDDHLQQAIAPACWTTRLWLWTRVRSARWPRRERCLPPLHSSSAPEALSAACGLWPAFWPQGQLPPNHTPAGRPKRAGFADRPAWHRLPLLVGAGQRNYRTPAAMRLTGDPVSGSIGSGFLRNRMPA